ncbi:MAG TPA: hypothetical protein VEG35_05325, partial [Burkholderiales bacterium]|nr:hypothetical protein [Burkholderiales bacterium]
MRFTPAAVPVLALGLGLLFAQPSAPQGQAAKRDVSDFEKRLASINAQISALRARIEAEALKETTVLSSLARINLNKDLVEREIAAQNVQMERARAELAAVQARVRELKAELDRENAAIEKTLVTLYKFGRLNFFHFLLQAQSFEAYTVQTKRLSLLARYQEDTVAAYLKTLAEFGE